VKRSPELETVTGIDVDRVVKTSTYELATRDKGLRRADVVLDQPDAIKRLLVAGDSVEIIGNGLAGLEKAHADAPTAAIRLQDVRTIAKVVSRRRNLVTTDRSYGARRAHTRAV
jgi:hypothetical protein